ncbi:hypothetical protein Gogos_021450, partial [Gossypium gossypioides]|nr:hypothetical protein [Gossypium gossypioides]
SDTSKDIWSTLLRLFSTKSTTKICDTLAACGNSLSEIEHVATILNGLPVEYDPFIVVIAASREPVSLEGACSILVDAETRQLNSTSHVADLVVDHTHNANFVARWDILLTDAFIGLIIPFRYKAIQLDLSVSATWFVDSEATHHVTNESQAFSAGKEYVGKGKVVVVFALDQLCTNLIS